MRTLLLGIITLIHTILIGCISFKEFNDKIERATNSDGLTKDERIAKDEDSAKEIEEKNQIRLVEVKACYDNSMKKKLSRMQADELCVPPNRKGLTNNNIAPFYFWYDGTEPFYQFYSKEGNFVLQEIDQTTIDQRRREDAESLYRIEQSKQELAQSLINLNNTISNIQIQNKLDRVQNQLNQRHNNLDQMNYQHNQQNTGGRVPVQMPAN